MKKLLKSKKGDFTIIAIVIVPIIATIVFNIIFLQMGETEAFKLVQTSLDNSLYYSAESYGQIKVDKNSSYFCDFDYGDLNGATTPTSLEATEVTDKTAMTSRANNKINWSFKNSLLKCDGYNDLWTYVLKIEQNVDGVIDPSKNENNEYITASVIVVLPNVNNEDYPCWGKATGSEWTNWYADNKEHWEDCVSRYNSWYSTSYEKWINGENVSMPKGLIILKLEVFASCY